MKFIETSLKGAYVIQLEKQGDDRGFFARFFCIKEFDAASLRRDVVQINNSLSRDKGTLRGMHYQRAPRAEDKIVRCVRGSLLDVIVDLRSESPTFLGHFKIELSADNRTALYVPKGFAHGFITLQDSTEVFYLVTEFYTPESERGMRYNDPRLGIEWPMEPVVISEKDKTWPAFDAAYHLG